MMLRSTLFVQIVLKNSITSPFLINLISSLVVSGTEIYGRNRNANIPLKVGNNFVFVPIIIGILQYQRHSHGVNVVTSMCCLVFN